MAEEKKKFLSSLKPKGPVNPWKWICLGLIALLLGVGIWGYSKVITPVNTIQDTKTQQVKQTVSFEVASKKAEINQLVAHSLNEFIEAGDIEYQFILNDEAELIGTFQVFGHDVQFYLYLAPYVTENGNVQLKATSLSIGQLDLPITYVMNFIAKQYKLPDWVQVDSKKQLILLNLNEYKLSNGMIITAKKIDLKTDDIRFNISLPLKEIKKTTK
ncbi:YpmS family protein [Carnobacterium gallinarum]|uniref:YpmS family protein n=1 Tax=Carnobacterium gallinarum TaxID=2749 RepID=UPI000554C3E6|nr:YpmS family protein [Carnobacterium gallinarum]